MKRKIAVVIVFLVFLLALGVNEINNQVRNAPYDAAYSTFTTKIRSDVNTLRENNSSNFRLISNWNNWTFSGDYILITDGFGLDYASFSSHDQKILDYSHLNLTTFYAVKTVGALVGTYEDGSHGYDATYTYYVIKYPEKTAIGSMSFTQHPPTVKVSQEKGVDQVGPQNDVGPAEVNIEGHHR